MKTRQADHLTAVLDEHPDRIAREVEDHGGDVAGWGHAEDLGVELAVAHAIKARAA